MDKVKRRVFINLLVGVSLSTLVPVPVDEYQNFLDSIRARVIKIVKREDRVPVRMEIAPPRVVKGEKVSHSVFVAGRRESLYVGRIVEFRMHDAMSGRQIGVH